MTVADFNTTISYTVPMSIVNSAWQYLGTRRILQEYPSYIVTHVNMEPQGLVVQIKPRELLNP